MPFNGFINAHMHASFGNFNLISKTDLFMCFHIVFQILFQILQDIKYRNILSVRTKLLPSIVYRLVFSLVDSKMGYVHVFAGSQVRRPVSYLQITNIFLSKCTALSRLFYSHRDKPIDRWGKEDSTPGKPPDTSASRAWLVPHVTGAGLKPTPATAVW